MKGFEHPLIKTDVPGELSKEWINKMREVEAPNITYTDADFPVFVHSAFMNNVWDIDGNRYLDLTSFFGVASVGHRNPEIRQIITEASIYHGMGDVHPSIPKVMLLEKLNNLLGGNFMGIFAQSGSEAVETCIKTQILYTKRPEIVVFEGAYHGLGFGAMNLTQRSYFKEGLEPYTGKWIHTLPFPEKNEEHVLNRLFYLLKTNKNIGMVFLEPIQGRGGVRMFKRDFLVKLRKITRNYSVLLGFDEIFTGMYRTGYLSYAKSLGIDFDLITLGKGLSSQFPLSVCLGKKEIMEKAWPESTGEAKHTYTFLGHPLFCEVSLKVLDIIENEKLDEKVRTYGKLFLEILKKNLGNKKSVRDVRGAGFMMGIEFKRPVFPLVKVLLKKGYITLPAGEHGNILEIIPTFYITEELFTKFVEVLSGLVD